MARVLKGSHVSFTCTPRVHPLKRTIPAFCFESLCLVLAVCLRVLILVLNVRILVFLVLNRSTSGLFSCSIESQCLGYDCGLTAMQRARTVSGGASAAKEPGHFEVRTSSSRSPRCIFFLKKS